MKIGIVGHTTGIGKHLFDIFDCDGFSRRNGYNIEHDIIKTYIKLRKYDVVILNAYANGVQLKLLDLIKDDIENIIVIGSIARLPFISCYLDKNYVNNKRILKNMCDEISISGVNILHITLSFMEGGEEEGTIQSDFTLSYEEISNVVRFWLDNKNINEIGFKFVITDHLMNQLRSKTK